MPTEIKCPRCGNEFAMEDAMTEELKVKLEKEKRDLRDQMITYKKQKEEELARKQEEFLQREKELQAGLEEKLRKSIGADFENKLRLLEQNQQDTEVKLKQARQKELEFLQKEQQLQHKEAELELVLHKRLQEERGKLSDELRKLEEQKLATRETEFQLRLKELEKQLEDQKKLADEMRRRAEQGSTQLQGEVQELVLEELLRNAFPYDEIAEVGKGVRGADCIQTVRNRLGQDCGRIIFESKRRKDFSNDWIEKLKSDMRSQGADMAILVTQTLPKDMEGFGEKDGVWICSFTEVRSIVQLLRESIIRLSVALKSQENRGEKMHMLYDYLTSSEFAGQWKAIREGFMSMKLSIQKERDAMEKLWKAREKQLEKVLLNAAHIKGSVEGIAGQDSVDLSLQEPPDEAALLPGND